MPRADRLAPRLSPLLALGATLGLLVLAPAAGATTCPIASRPSPPTTESGQALVRWCTYQAVVAARREHTRMAARIVELEARVNVLDRQVARMRSAADDAVGIVNRIGRQVAIVQGGVRSIFDAVRLHGTYVANIAGQIAHKLGVTGFR